MPTILDTLIAQAPREHKDVLMRTMRGMRKEGSFTRALAKQRPSAEFGRWFRAQVMGGVR